MGVHKIVSDQRVATVMFGDAILRHVPRRKRGSWIGTNKFESRANMGVGAFPQSAQEGLGVGEDDDLLDIFNEPAHLLNGCECAMLIKAGHRIVDNNDFPDAVRVAL